MHQYVLGKPPVKAVSINDFQIERSRTSNHIRCRYRRRYLALKETFASAIQFIHDYRIVDRNLIVASTQLGRCCMHADLVNNFTTRVDRSR